MVIKTHYLPKPTLQSYQGVIKLKNFGETAATIKIFFNSEKSFNLFLTKTNKNSIVLEICYGLQIP